MKKSKAKEKGRYIEVSVVGLSHRVTHTLLLEMKEKLPIRCYLQREPRNAHDPNAVKVLVHPVNDFKGANWHIGYLRRSFVAKFAPLLDDGKLKVNSCTLVQLDEEHHGAEGLLRILLEDSGELETPVKDRP